MLTTANIDDKLTFQEGLVRSREPLDFDWIDKATRGPRDVY